MRIRNFFLVNHDLSCTRRIPKTRNLIGEYKVIIMRNSILVLAALTALTNPASAQLVISGVIDGPLSGGVPKAVEVYVAADIADLSIYGLGGANNGGGTDGEEFTFPAVAASAGDFIYVASESPGFTDFFGFAPDYTTSAASINGDDAIELFKGGTVVDVFGDINVDGSDEPWEYMDGWAYRVDTTGPDGAAFTLGNWTFSGPNALDGASTSATAATPFPLGTYVVEMGDVAPTVRRTNPVDGTADIAEDAHIEITFSEAVTVAGTWFGITCDSSGGHTGAVSSGDDTTYSIDPDSNFVAGDSCTVTVFATQVSDQDDLLDNMTADFSFSFDVPPPVLIHDVQGTGASSPFAGLDQVVIIKGIVVGDFQDGASGTHGDLNGFFVQEEDSDADANPLTSEGIFVFNGSNPAVDVQIGDQVRVEGEVSEIFGMTQITSITGVTVLSGGNAIPTASALSLPVARVGDFEAYEGMRVTFPQALVISDYFNFDQFGEIILTSTRHLTPTAEFEPGPDAIAAADAFLLDRITLDDGRTNQNPDPAIHPNGSEFDLTNLFRGGDTVADVTGVLNYAFGLYRVQPTQGATHTVENPRPLAPDAVGGDLRVASANVLNYFTTLDYPSGDPLDNMCGPFENMGCRGADNAEELARQRAKIISSLSAMDADIVGLVEIENNVSDDALIDLVAGLNDATAPGTYDCVATGTIGTDAIKVALIYKPASVSPVGGHAILDSIVDPRFLDDKNRPTLAQSFFDNVTGGTFTVAVNHFKSKGSNCNNNIIPDPDTGDGSGNCNLTRTAAAEALVDWLASDPTASGDEDFLVIGDLNAYDKETPIDALVAGGYLDLVADFKGEDAYSFVFSGQTGYLDHALASESLSPQVTGATEWHINADEPDLIDYDTSFKQDAQDAIYAPDAYRSSDHDPVIVGLDTGELVAPTIDAIVTVPHDNGKKKEKKKKGKK
jgi:predicted extracellular nuclease